MTFFLGQQSNYPFTDASSLISREGKIFPRGAFLEAAIQNKTQYPVSMTGITKQDDILLFTFGYDRQPNIISMLYSGQYHIGDINHSIDLMDDNGDYSGNIMIGDAISEVFQWENGEYSFYASAAQFESSANIPIVPEGVSLEQEVISGNNGVIFQVDGNSIICNFVGSPVYEHIVAGTCGSAANYIAGIWFKVIEFGELKYETDFIVPDERGNIEMLAGVPSGLSTALRFATSDNTIIVSVANATMDDNMQNVRLAGVR